MAISIRIGADNGYYVREAQEEWQKKKTQGGCVNTGWAKEERQKKESRMCTGTVGY